MCFALYLAADNPLPLRAWDEHAPAFYVTTEDIHQRPIPILSKPYVYYLGSHQGCGCGFRVAGIPPEWPEYAERMQNHEQLVEYLEAATKHGPVELFMSWEGDEQLQPQDMGHIRVVDIKMQRVAFRDGQLFVVDQERVP